VASSASARASASVSPAGSSRPSTPSRSQPGHAAHGAGQHGHARGQRLDHHLRAAFGAAGQGQQVEGGVDVVQVAARPQPVHAGRRQLGRELSGQRPVAHDQQCEARAQAAGAGEGGQQPARVLDGREAPQATHQHRARRQAEALAQRGAGGRVGPHALEVDAGRHDAVLLAAPHAVTFEQLVAHLRRDGDERVRARAQRALQPAPQRAARRPEVARETWPWKVCTRAGAGESAPAASRPSTPAFAGVRVHDVGPQLAHEAAQGQQRARASSSGRPSRPRKGTSHVEAAARASSSRSPYARAGRPVASTVASRAGAAARRAQHVGGRPADVQPRDDAQASGTACTQRCASAWCPLGRRGPAAVPRAAARGTETTSPRRCVAPVGAT
jgi:hypothetical protein